MRRITSYQALWRPVENKGHFWFTYSDGDRERTMDLDPESFRTMMKVLDTENPIFADHATSVIAVNSQPNGQKVKAFS